MTAYITTPRDLEILIDEAIGSGGDESPESRQAMKVQLAGRLWREGHDAGLRAGYDWGKWLDEHLTTDRMNDILEELEAPNA